MFEEGQRSLQTKKRNDPGKKKSSEFLVGHGQAASHSLRVSVFSAQLVLLSRASCNLTSLESGSPRISLRRRDNCLEISARACPSYAN